jgi:hypothetical protein
MRRFWNDPVLARSGGMTAVLVPAAVDEHEEVVAGPTLLSIRAEIDAPGAVLRVAGAVSVKLRLSRRELRMPCPARPASAMKLRRID